MSGSKTVVVLGCAYGGARAATQLASTLPEDWKVVVIDRNTHLNYVYVLPRVIVNPGHEGKAFVPYTNIFTHANKSLGPVTAHSTTLLHASITSMTPHSVTLDKSFPEHGYGDGVVEFEYAVYALGSALSPPVNLWGRSLETRKVKSVVTEQVLSEEVEGQGEEQEVVEEVVEETVVETEPGVEIPPYTGEKAQSLEWIRRTRSRIDEARTVLVVGGGALGVQMSTDIAELYPEKQVTLLHSRDKLLNRFDEEVHTQILLTLDSLNVTTILGERLTTWPDDSYKGQVRTDKGRVLTADLILTCTGQTPNTQLLAAMDPRVVDAKSGMARVRRTMQLVRIPREELAPQEREVEAKFEAEAEAETEEEPDYSHIFVVGDAADAFGAMKAGHTAYWQAIVACTNLVKMIKASQRAEAAAEAELDESVASLTLADDTSDEGSTSTAAEELHQHDSDQTDSELKLNTSADSSWSSSLSLSLSTPPTPSSQLARFKFKLEEAQAAREVAIEEAVSEEGSQGDEESLEEEDMLEEEQEDEVEEEEEEDLSLEEYAPGAPSIKVTLGIKHAVYQVNGEVGTKDDGHEDAGAAYIWPYFGLDVKDDAGYLL